MEESKFENALRGSPNDREVLRQYADWLSNQGDPRAEILKCEMDLRDARRRLRDIESKRSLLSSSFEKHLDWLDSVLPNYIVAPISGTFYSAPEPDSQPYVALHAYCHASTVVGIIEADNMFYEVAAEHVGVVSEILIKGHSKVESGQLLFKISRPPLFRAGG